MKTFKKSFKINAEPSDIYSAITNPYTIELWTGYPAIMSEVPDSEFSLWDGDITGKNIEFIKDKKIVQEWYGGKWEKPSILTITLKKVKEGIEVKLKHEGVPKEEVEGIKDGWDEYYFWPIKEMLEK